jgi:Domain of unknown function (DUF4926)
MSHGSPQPSSSRTPTRQTSEALGLLDVVRVRKPLPKCGLAGGEEGTIVEIVDHPRRAYLVDFSGGSADPAEAGVPVFSLTADQIVLVWKAP